MIEPYYWSKIGDGGLLLGINEIGNDSLKDRDYEYIKII